MRKSCLDDVKADLTHAISAGHFVNVATDFIPDKALKDWARDEGLWVRYSQKHKKLIILWDGKGKAPEDR